MDEKKEPQTTELTEEQNETVTGGFTPIMGPVAISAGLNFSFVDPTDYKIVDAESKKGTNNGGLV